MEEDVLNYLATVMFRVAEPASIMIHLLQRKFKKNNQKYNCFSADRGRKASSSGKQKDSVLGVLCLGNYIHNRLPNPGRFAPIFDFDF